MTVEICSETFGERGDPAVLLIMGAMASMLWWPDEFCRRLADAGRFVIRYDHRDTGRSTSYEHGRPGYTGSDLVLDAVAVLDAHDVPAAHVVGVSAGGAFAQALALDFPDRVVSLVLISSSPVVPIERPLPPPDAAFMRFFATTQVDWSDASSVIEYTVAYARMLAGAERRFDEAAMRELVRRDVERARDFAAVQNHDSIPHGTPPGGSLASIGARTLVIHGSADPMFPAEHGRALADEIGSARLMTLEGAGHGVDRADWDTLAQAIVDHTTTKELP